MKICEKCKKTKIEDSFKRMDIHSGIEEGDFSVCNECVGYQKKVVKMRMKRRQNGYDNS